MAWLKTRPEVDPHNIGLIGHSEGGAIAPMVAARNRDGSLKVFVAVEACDMRKGFNGLHAVVTERLGEEPRAGALFVFSNRRHTRIKILCWDGHGIMGADQAAGARDFFLAEEPGAGNDQAEVDPAGAGDVDRWRGFARRKIASVV